MHYARQGLISCKGFFLCKCSLEAPVCPFTQHSLWTKALPSSRSTQPHHTNTHRLGVIPNTTTANSTGSFSSRSVGCTSGLAVPSCWLWYDWFGVSSWIFGWFFWGLVFDGFIVGGESVLCLFSLSIL